MLPLLAYLFHNLLVTLARPCAFHIDKIDINNECIFIKCLPFVLKHVANLATEVSKYGNRL